jgi:hypothetical protein
MRQVSLMRNLFPLYPNSCIIKGRGIKVRELLGYFLIAQAIITGVIVYSIQQLSVSISQSAAYIATQNGQISWSEEVPSLAFVSLVVVAVLGLFLVVIKKTDR